MAEWSQGYVEANGLEVAYHRGGAGSGKPPLVFLHGYTDNAMCWSRIAHDLEADYDVILPDARGHGRTRGPVDDMRINLLAQDAADFIRELNLEKPLLFGHSMGAMTALAVAANHPELVRAAVLEDPPFKPAHPFVLTEQEARLLQQDGEDGLIFQKQPLAERIARGRTDNPKWSEDELLPWAESKGEYNPEIVPFRVAFRSYNWRKALARVGCPLLLITGDVELGALVTAEMAEEAPQICSSCEVIHISGAGHSVHRDRYDETLQRVTDFLARVL